jgi:hypothetical protein
MNVVTCGRLLAGLQDRRSAPGAGTAISIEPRKIAARGAAASDGAEADAGEHEYETMYSNYR